MLMRIVRLVLRHDGQSMVEFALVLPVLVLILFGISDLGRLVFIYADVSNSAREGSRYGIVYPSRVSNSDNANPNNISAKAKEKVWMISQSDLTVSVSFPDTVSGNPKVGDRIVVSISAPFEMVTPMINEIYKAVVPASERRVVFVSTRTIMREGTLAVPSSTPTSSPTSSPTSTPTVTPTGTATPTPTMTPTPTSTPSPTPTTTPTVTPTGTVTPTPTPTPTPSPTPTATSTPTPTPTPTATPKPKYLVVTFVSGYPAKQNGANKPIFIKVTVTDQDGVPVNDAAVSFQAPGLSGGLSHNSGTGGVYGDGANCWSGGSFKDEVSVTVTAKKAGYSDGITSGATAGNSAGKCP
jgi:Flp pilus assembly protein TadG